MTSARLSIPNKARNCGAWGNIKLMRRATISWRYVEMLSSGKGEVSIRESNMQKQINVTTPPPILLAVHFQLMVLKSTQTIG